jgi:GH15 family glucan-1,4-alpha-glucosidase
MPLPKPALALVITAVVLVTGGAAAQPPVVAALRFGGITADPRAPDGIRSLPAGPHEADAPPDAAQRRWLAGGLVPGATRVQRATAARALLDIRLLTRPDGAVAAAWRPGWEYAWPRDSSWVAAALAVTGHGGKALDILRFLARVQPRAGIWAARYQLSGDAPVRDGRPAELDADGWFPWAAWIWYTTQRRGRTARRALGELWPAVHVAADTTVALLGRSGLPPASLDYWEDGVSSVTLGIAAPLSTGLRAAAELARALDHAEDAGQWSAAARRLGRAIGVSFGADGYQRTPDPASGADAAVTFLGPPFARATPAVRRAVAATARRLTLPNGGIAPGSAWGGAAGEAWTAETAFFALYDADCEDHAGADHWLDWLAAHRTGYGSLPEQVNARGQPASVAPLAWTDAIVLLALAAQRHPLPMP